MLRLLIATYLLAFIVAAHARDNGQYAQNPLKGWFDGLKSSKGFCCSDADGEPTEYETRGGSYWAPIDGIMTEVPADAVITEPNRVGHAMKWIYQIDGRKAFRCFIPGAGI